MAIEVLQVAHCNVNCSDLDQSRRFYEELVGLSVGAHTAPPPQDCRQFGLAGEGQWDAYMMVDERGQGAAPALDLLEWKAPKPVGTPYAEANHLGMFRVCFLTPDIDATFARAQSLGVPCTGPPCDVTISADFAQTVRALFCRDPDGTLVEFIEVPGTAPRFAHVNVNCSDLARSRAWYQRVFAFEVRGESKPAPGDGAVFGLEGEVQWEAAFLAPKASEAFVIDLLEWKNPKPIGAPYAEANHLGIFRMAFLVRDIHACVDELRRLGVATSDAVFLDMGPDIPVDGVWACFFPDPDGTCLELIQSPV